MKGKRTALKKMKRNRRGSTRIPRTARSARPPENGSLSLRKEAAHREFLLESGELPATYGVTKVVLLPLDPFLVNVFWEISPKDIRKIRRLVAAHSPHPEPVLRFYEVSDAMHGKGRSRDSFDIPVDLKARNWYVHLWSGGKSYFVELGLRTADDRFFSLGRSNTAAVPPSKTFQESGSEYLLVAGDYDVIKKVRVAEMLPDGLPFVPSIHRTPAARRTQPETRRSKSEQASGSTASSVVLIAHILQRRELKNDLSERCERAFVFGISSELFGSYPAGAGSGDR